MQSCPIDEHMFIQENGKKLDQFSFNTNNNNGSPVEPTQLFRYA
jgi:hypothetical protein